MQKVFSFLKKGWVITLMLGFLVLNSFYHDVLFAPNKHVFNPSGDGLKNYFTSAYFIKNNQSLSSFDGMNYPFGESVMYTDGHPALSYFLKTLSVVIPDIDTNIIGILNTIMMLSFLLTAFVIYRIFKLLNFHTYFASFSAVALTFLSPQSFRLQGHYSLSYSFCIPLTILLLLKISQNQKPLLNTILLTLNNLLWFFIHPYLGLMTAGTSLLFSVLTFVNFKKQKNKITKRSIGTIFLSGLLPILIFLSVSKLLDNHEYRPTNPYGIHEYHATFESVFLPNRPPFKQNIQQFYEYDGTTSWEGVSYIGIISFVLIFIYLMRSIKVSFENSKIIFFNDWLPHTHLRNLVLTSILFMFFSMLLPFRWGFEDLVDQLSFLKQFRALGRFSWVFYYVTGITVLYIINQHINNLLSRNIRKWAYALIVGVPFLYLSEGFAYHREISKSIAESDNIFSLKRSPENIKEAVKFIKKRKYQGLIPLPYYHIGSDNYGKGGSEKSMQLSMILSFQSGTPLVSSHLARTSLKETRDLFQLFSESHTTKKLSKHISSDLPFLILHSKDYLVPNEIELLNRAIKLEDYGDFALYEITKQTLFADSKLEEEKLFLDKKNLHKQTNYWVTDTTKFYFHKSFDHSEKDTSYVGGGKKMSAKNYNVLFSTKNMPLKRNTNYEVSCWVHVGNSSNYYGQDNMNYRLFLEEQKPEKTNWIKIVSPGESMTIDGSWSQIKFRFWANENTEYKIFLFDTEDSEQIIYADEFLIREVSLDIYENRKGMLLKNSQKVKKLENPD